MKISPNMILQLSMVVFSVAKATLQSQMSVCSFVHPSVCQSVCKTHHTAKNQSFHLNNILITMHTTILATMTFILTIIPTIIIHSSSFHHPSIILPSSFLHLSFIFPSSFLHPSFILQLLSFSACF